MSASVGGDGLVPFGDLKNLVMQRLGDRSAEAWSRISPHSASSLVLVWLDLASTSAFVFADGEPSHASMLSSQRKQRTCHGRAPS